MKAELPWFRMYADAIDDEKLRLLAFEDRWHFVAILCCKRKGILDAGDAPALLRRKMAVKLGLAARELDAMADRLGELGLIDPVTFQPTAWDERQFKSDSSKERVQRYRDRRQAAGQPRSGGYQQHLPALMERDGGRCVYCASTENLCIDHLVPTVAGGTDDLDNLAIACKRCNSGKAGRTPEQAGYRIDCAAAASAHTRYLSRPVTVSVTPPSVSVSSSAGDVALEAIATKTSFADWWAVYPLKVGKKPCEQKWKARKLDAIADVLIADTINRTANDSGWLGGFVPNPETYLNQERWNDDLRTAPVARPAASEPSKTLGAMLKIRGMTNGLADNRTAARANETALLEFGSDSGE